MHESQTPKHEASSEGNSPTKKFKTIEIATKTKDEKKNQDGYYYYERATPQHPPSPGPTPQAS